MTGNISKASNIDSTSKVAQQPFLSPNITGLNIHTIRNLQAKLQSKLAYLTTVSKHHHYDVNTDRHISKHIPTSSARRITENIYQTSTADGFGLIRAHLAIKENNSDWLTKKSLHDIYSQLPLFETSLKNALKEALQVLHLESILTDEASRAENIFLRGSFLSKMQTQTHFNLFHPQNIRAFALNNNIDMDEDEAMTFAAVLSAKFNNNLMHSLGMVLDDNGLICINDNVHLEAIPSTSGYVVYIRENQLAGNEAYETHEISAPIYIKHPYRNGLAQFKTPYANASETLYRNWLSLVDDANPTQWLTATPLEITTALSRYEGFRKSFITAISETVTELVDHSSLEKSQIKILSRQLVDSYINVGDFDIQSAIVKIIDDTPLIKEQLGLQTNAALQAKLNGFQQKVEARLLNKLGYQAFSEAALQDSKLETPDEFFVVNADGSYSFVTVENFFEPLGKPKDPELFERSVKEDPQRHKLSSLLKRHHGGQVLEKLRSQKEKKYAPNPQEIDGDTWFDAPEHLSTFGSAYLEKNQDGTYQEIRNEAEPYWAPDTAAEELWQQEISDNREDWLSYPHSTAKDLWQQAQAAEKETEKKPNTKPRVDLDEANYRDGLFNKQEAIDAGVNLLIGAFEKFNYAAELLGFNTQPVKIIQPLRIDDQSASTDPKIKSSPHEAAPPHDLRTVTRMNDHQPIGIIALDLLEQEEKPHSTKVKEKLDTLVIAKAKMETISTDEVDPEVAEVLSQLIEDLKLNLEQLYLAQSKMHPKDENAQLVDELVKEIEQTLFENISLRELIQPAKQKAAKEAQSKKLHTEKTNKLEEFVEQMEELLTQTRNARVINEDSYDHESEQQKVDELVNIFEQPQEEPEVENTWDFFKFPHANARPIPEKPKNPSDLDDNQHIDEEYEQWVKEHGEEANKPHSRAKRRVTNDPANQPTPEDMVGFKVKDVDSQLLNRIQELVKVQDASTWTPKQKQNHYDMILAEIKRIASYDMTKKVDHFIHDFLDALKMTGMENDVDFANGYAFLWMKNSESLQQNREFYFHQRLEDFAGDATKGRKFQTLIHSSSSLNDKFKILAARIYYELSIGNKLDKVALGMAYAYLDYNELSLSAPSKEIAKQKTLSGWDSLHKANPDSMVQEQQLKAWLTKQGIKGDIAKPIWNSQGVSLDRAAGSSGRESGYCHYLSLHSQLMLENNGIEGIVRLENTMDMMKRWGAADPVQHNILINALDAMNDDQFEYKTPDGKGITAITNAATTQEETITKAWNSPYGTEIDILGPNGGGHAVSLGKAKTPDGRTIAFFIDANRGVYPCYTLEQFRFVLQNAVDPYVSGSLVPTFNTIDFTPENIDFIKTLRNAKGQPYGTLDLDILKAQKQHSITQHPAWESLLDIQLHPELTTDDAQNAVIRYKDGGTVLDVDDLVRLLADERNGRTQRTVPMQTDNIQAELADAKPAKQYYDTKGLTYESLKTFLQNLNEVGDTWLKLNNQDGGKPRTISLQLKIHKETQNLRALLSRKTQPYSSQRAALTLEVAAELNRVRQLAHMQGFIEADLEAFVMKMAETDPHVLEGFKYYESRMKQEVNVNGRLFADIELEQFYQRQLGNAFHDPELGISQRIDYLAAKMYMADAEGTVVNGRQLGLALADLSLHRQILANRLQEPYSNEIIRHSLDALKKPRSRAAARTIDASMQGYVLKDGKTRGFQPFDVSFQHLASETLLIKPNLGGIADILTLGFAHSMAKRAGTLVVSNTDSLRKVVASLDTFSDNLKDPKQATNLLNGLGAKHKELKFQLEALNPHRKVSSYETVRAGLPSLNEPVFLTFGDKKAGTGHSISVVPVYEGNVKAYAVFDPNLGFIPCSNADMAAEIIKISINRYLGQNPNNQDFSSLKLTSLSINAEVGDILTKTTFQIGSEGDFRQVTLKDFYVKDTVSWADCSTEAGAYNQKQWINVLPESLAPRQTASISSASTQSDSSSTKFLQELDMMANGKGATSSDLAALLTEDVQSTKTVTQEELTIKQELIRQQTQGAVDDATSALPKDFESVKSIPADKPLRDTSGRVLVITEPAGATSDSLPKSGIAQDTVAQRINELSIRATAADEVVKSGTARMTGVESTFGGRPSFFERYRKAFTSKFRRQTTHQTAGTVVQTQSIALGGKVVKASDALVGAAIVDPETDAAKVQVKRTNFLHSTVQQEHAQAGASGRIATNLDGKPSLNIVSKGKEMSIPLETSSQEISMHQKFAQKLGQDLLEGTSKQYVRENTHILLEEFAKPIEQVDVENVATMLHQELEFAAAKIMEDPVLMRQVTSDVELLQLEMHQMKLLSVEMAEAVDRVLIAQGKSPDDWEVLPPSKLGNNDGELSFVYRGSDIIDDSVIRIEVPEDIKVRLDAIKSDMLDASSSLSLEMPKQSSMLHRVLHSNAYARLGDFAKIVGKIMNLVNLYNLIKNAGDLKNLAPIHKAAFIIAGLDTAVDLAANIVGAANYFYKLAHAGGAHLGLQSASRFISKFSAGVGLISSISQAVAAGFALANAETDFEKQVARANFAFATASVVMTVFAMTVPIAAPIVAIAGLIMMGIQYAVMQNIIEAEKKRLSQKELNERFESTEKLLRILETIASADMDDISFEENSGKLTITIQAQDAAEYIVVEEGKITLHHGMDSYSASYATNSDLVFETVRENQTEIKTAVLIRECDLGKACNQKLKSKQINKMLKESGACFKEGETEYQAYSASLLNKKMLKDRVYTCDAQGALCGIGGNKNRYSSKLFTLEERKTETVIPCLLLESQYIGFEKKFAAYLSKTTAYNSDSPQKRMIFNYIQPKVTLVSDVIHYVENEYQVKQQPQKHLVNAIRGDICKPRFNRRARTFNKVCAEAKSAVPTSVRDNVCVLTPQLNWNTKSHSTLAPKVKDCDGKWSEQRTLMEGPSFFVAKQNVNGNSFVQFEKYGVEAGRKAGASAPEEITASTVFSQAILDFEEKTITKVDLTETEELDLILYPEKYATEIIAKTNFYFTVQAPTDSSKSSTKPESMTLPINDKTYEMLQDIPVYYIDLVANQGVNLIAALGSRTEITELDKKDGGREGSYFVSMKTSFTTEEQKAVLKNLDTQIEEKQSALALTEAELRDNRGNYDYAKTRLEELQNEPGYSPSSSQVNVNHLKEEVQKYQKALNESMQKKATLQYYHKDLTKMRAGYANRLADNAEQLKTIISLTEQNGEKTLKIIFNPQKDRSALSRLNEAELEIKDIKRGLVLFYPEQITINGKTLLINCLYTINTDNELEFSLSNIQGMSAADVALLSTEDNLAKFISQLKTNNPQLTIPDGIIISQVQLTDEDNKLVGRYDNVAYFKGAMRTKRGEVVLTTDDAKDYSGHVLVSDLNSSHPQMVAVYYRHDLPNDEKKDLLGLGFIGKEKITNKSKVPSHLIALYESLPESLRYVYFLYNQETKTLVTQHMNSVIKATDIKTCALNEFPTLYPTVSRDTEQAYICLPPDHLDLNEEINSCRTDPQSCQNFFTYLEQKRTNENLPEKLSLNNPGFDLPTEGKIPLFMQYAGGEEPSLLMIPKQDGMGVLLRNELDGYALIGKKVNEPIPAVKKQLARLNVDRIVAGQPELFEIDLHWTSLIKGETLERLGVHFAKEGYQQRGIEAGSVSVLNSLTEDFGIHIISIEYTEDGITFSTSDGVSFFIGANFEERYLRSVEACYFEEKGIDTSDVTAMTQAYRELISLYGKPKSAYFKLFTGISATETTGEKHMVIMDVGKQLPLFIPRTPKTSERTAFVGSLEAAGQITQLTCLDPISESLSVVRSPTSYQDAVIEESLDYVYFGPTESGGVVMSVRGSDEENTMLPFLPVANLYFLAQRNRDQKPHTRVELSPHQLEQSELVTLTAPMAVQTDALAQKINIPSDPTKSLKAFVRNRVRQFEPQPSNATTSAPPTPAANIARFVDLELFIAVPKPSIKEGQQKSLFFKKVGLSLSDITKEYTLVRLHHAFNPDDSLKADFDGCIAVNGKTVTLSELKALIVNATTLPDPDFPSEESEVKKVNAIGN